ncbi:hypothetical protein [Rickettsia australis]|uniref:Uncharacterized protein n=1 Tax=Rickettsia australis (strain Cutlack) TaxID=1105110 RepID=H8K9J7_RICAC|nr:hypothetical protein [Rickettsia australis]AFC70717.1 hypothetical protein MC5_01625 [Rickettsia australis str. Cutlack]
MNHILHFSLTTVARLTNTIKTIGGQGYYMLKIGHNVASYYLTTTFSLIEQTCHKENILTTLCSKGIELLNTETRNFIFEGMFKIKEVLNANKTIITAINDNGQTIRDYILQKQGDKIYIYEERLLKICQENLQEKLTIEGILSIAGDNNHIIGDIKGCEIFEVEKENTLQALLSEIKDLIANPISSTTQASDINTTNKWTESVTEYLSEMATNAIDNTITNATAEIAESIFSDNTESWTETGINLITNTVANFTNNTFNTTYNSQENMFDERDNDNSLVAYIGIGTAVAASIVVAIGAGVTWYCVRSNNAKKAKLKQYIDEIEAERAAAAIAEDTLAAKANEEHNDHTTVEMTGLSYAGEDTHI